MNKIKDCDTCSVNGVKCEVIHSTDRDCPKWIDKLAPDTNVGDKVNHPSHYNQGKYECIDVMAETFGKEAVLNFCKLNAFKYLWRAEDKNGHEDINKALWYLNKYIELTKGE